MLDTGYHGCDCDVLSRPVSVDERPAIVVMYEDQNDMDMTPDAEQVWAKALVMRPVKSQC